jgi:sulfite dehydrogenase (quinone) subunit SoeC
MRSWCWPSRCRCCCWWALWTREPAWLLLALAMQYVGLLAERWFFFAQARHPQNLYYQVVS